MRLLADLALFVEVANTKHFGRAAAALDVPASTLSRRISALEKELGLPLINRSTRSFALTESGQACYERARRLVSDARRIREELGENAAAISGHIRVGLPEDLALTVFTPIFAEFCRASPGVSLEVITIHGYPNLLTEALDVAFVVGHQMSLPDSAFTARRLGTFARMLFASRQYLRQKGVPQEPADLAKHACIRFSLGTLQKQWELRRGKQRQTVTVNGICSANSVGLMAQLARENLGIAMTSLFLARQPAFGAGLIRVLPEWEGTPASLFALTASQMLPAKLERLLAAVRASFAKRISELES